MLIHQLTMPRRDSNTLFEIVIWPSGGGRSGTEIYYLIVSNDGVFRSYIGRSRSSCGSYRTHRFLRSVQQSAEVTLSEEEFLRVSELVEQIITTEDDYLWPVAWTNSYIIFLYNGKIYENCAAWIAPLDDLVHALNALTPLPFWDHRNR